MADAVVLGFCRLYRCGGPCSLSAHLDLETEEIHPGVPVKAFLDYTEEGTHTCGDILFVL